MPLGQDYSTGTISVANGSATVTLVDGMWNDVLEGDLLWPVGYAPSFVAADVVSPFDVLTLKKNWNQASVVAGTYVLLRTSWKRYVVSELQAVFRDVANKLEASGYYVYVQGAAPDPEMGDENQLALKTNDGPLKLWKKVSGVWTEIGTLLGTVWRAAWNSGTAYLINDEVSRNGSSYIAKQISTNKPPESEPTYWDLTASKGDTGNDGGVVTIPYTFSTTTSIADPTAGRLRLDNATQNAAINIVADVLDNRGIDFTTVLDAMFGTTSTVRGTVRLHKASDTTKFLLFNVTAIPTQSGFRQLTATCIGSSGATPFANDDAIVLNATRTGDKGTPGAVWFYGTTVPDDGSGVNGDLYLRTTTSDVYQKAAGTWGSVLVNIKGLPGATWYYGSGVPSDGSGVNGDFYFRTSTSDVYVKASNTWGSPAVNLTGLTGVRGFAGGAAALPYTLDGLSVMDSDPGTGKLRFGAVPQNASTVLRVSTATALGSPVGPLLAALGLASTSTIKVAGRIFVAGNAAKMMEFNVTAVAALVGYYNITIAVVNSSAPDPFADGDSIILDWAPKGDKGDAATVAVGTVTTGDAGSAAQVSNVGTSVAAVLNFLIPRGDKGDPFSPSYVVALIADRAAYDTGPVLDANGKRLSVLVTSDAGNSNLPTLYFLQSIGPAVWSTGFTFQTPTAASAITYSNATSGLAATTSQAAIDEIEAQILDIPDPVAMALIFGG